jgi:hypothetical protein
MRRTPVHVPAGRRAPSWPVRLSGTMLVVGLTHGRHRRSRLIAGNCRRCSPARRARGGPDPHPTRQNSGRPCCLHVSRGAASSPRGCAAGHPGGPGRPVVRRPVGGGCAYRPGEPGRVHRPAALDRRAALARPQPRRGLRPRTHLGEDPREGVREQLTSCSKAAAGAWAVRCTVSGRGDILGPTRVVIAPLGGSGCRHECWPHPGCDLRVGVVVTVWPAKRPRFHLHYTPT